jgi:hypothetical protein
MNWQPSLIEANADERLLEKKFVSYAKSNQACSQLIEIWCSQRFKRHPYLFAATYWQAQEPPSSRGLTNYALKEKIKESLRRANRNKSNIGCPIDILPIQKSLATPSIERASTLLKEIGKSPILNPVSDTNYRKYYSNIKKAILLLIDLWPEMAQEISVTIKQIVLFDSESAIGFADIQSHGAIYLRASKNYSTIKLLEDIVHESSHVRLNSVCALRRLYANNENELFITPLRQDPRPMFGLMHQAFVLRRLLCLYSKDWPCEKSEIVTQRRRVEKSLISALETIQKNAKLTWDGRALISELKRGVYGQKK